MLSIGRLGIAGGADYYLDKVANNVDDYYLGRGEAPGQWIGATAEELGLIGQVDAGGSPEPAGRELGATGGLGPPGPAGSPPRLRPDVLGSQGRLACCGRSGRTRSVTRSPPPTTGRSPPSSTTCRPRPATPVEAMAAAELIEANGFIGAAFRHRTSRAGDPQLHTHVVVPNLVQGADGRWSAPDGRHLYAWKMTAGTLYRSALRAELAPLGLAWDVRRNGLSELRDIPKAILRAFSKRRVDIEAAMDARGARRQRRAETAALATRQRKPAAAAPGRPPARGLVGAARRRSTFPTARAAPGRPVSTT